ADDAFDRGQLVTGVLLQAPLRPGVANVVPDPVRLELPVAQQVSRHAVTASCVSLEDTLRDVVGGGDPSPFMLNVSTTIEAGLVVGSVQAPVAVRPTERTTPVNIHDIIMHVEVNLPPTLDLLTGPT